MTPDAQTRRYVNYLLDILNLRNSYGWGNLMSGGNISRDARKRGISQSRLRMPRDCKLGRYIYRPVALTKKMGIEGAPSVSQDGNL